MLEAHAPHEAVQTWRGFFIHIGAIVVGLIIAVSLEQTVEFFHHRHQRLLLEEQMHEVLEDDAQIAPDIKRLTDLRAYLVDLQSAVSARRRGRSTPAAPAADDPRLNMLIRLPSLAPYEAAKQNGTVALLSSERIRLYNRLSLQRDLMMSVYEHWFDDLAAVDAFSKRFEYAPGVPVLGKVDLATLSSPELIEYQALLGTVIGRVDWMILRMRLFATQCRAILDGARDEADLVKRVSATYSTGFEASDSSVTRP